MQRRQLEAVDDEKLTYREPRHFGKNTICWYARRLLDCLVTGKQVHHALRRFFIEEQLDVSVRLCGGGGAAKEHFLFKSVECRFNVTGVRGYGLPEFRAVVHREICSFAGEGRHQVRCIADQGGPGQAVPSVLDRKHIDRAKNRIGFCGSEESCQRGGPIR